MSATVFLDTPMDEEERIECAEAKIVGDIVWAAPEGDDAERVVPMSNVTGVTGDEVEQDIKEVEFPGGRVTELITFLS